MGLDLRVEAVNDLDDTTLSDVRVRDRVRLIVRIRLRLRVRIP